MDKAGKSKLDLELEELEKEFKRKQEELKEELAKVPALYAKSQKLMRKVALLQEGNKTALETKKNPQVPPEDVKNTMESICNFADLLKFKDNNGEPLSVAEMKSISEKLKKETTKINLVTDYLAGASSTPSNEVSPGESSSDFSPNNTFEGK